MAGGGGPLACAWEKALNTERGVETPDHIQLHANDELAEKFVLGAETRELLGVSERFKGST